MSHPTHPLSILLLAVSAISLGSVALLASRAPSPPYASEGETKAPVSPAEPPWLPSTPTDLDASREVDPREAVLHRMAAELALSPVTVAKVRRIFFNSSILGSGNPRLTVHPMTREACREIRKRAGIEPVSAPRCQANNMVPVFNPDIGQTAADTTLCIDQFEFPNLVCEYPIVHATAREAVEFCEALDKRLCDAHEWEGACAGALRAPDAEYAWGKSRSEMTIRHNAARERIWAYGSKKDHRKCATGSRKSKTCTGGGYQNCGSNTYPTGAFLECMSAFGVYDQHGNAAEHMSLPLVPSELGSHGGHGWTEMKGSWFIFARTEAHEDDCRWRAPDWHGSRTTDPKSHSNYHLGFRCCRDVAPATGT